VQLVNGYKYRRFCGSRISAKQSAQVAMSDITSAVFEPPCSLSRIVKPE
jgi:hypothetical protein